MGRGDEGRRRGEERRREEEDEKAYLLFSLSHLLIPSPPS